jgi:aspartate/methionine/tyrosine aminotransferase
MASEPLPPGRVSSRGARAIAPALSYFGKHLQGLPTLRSAARPDGHVLCAVAENRIADGALLARLAAVRAAGPLPGAENVAA